MRAWRSWSPGAKYFLYVDGQAWGEFSSSTGSGALDAITAYAPDGLVGRRQCGAWEFYAYDPQGSVAQRTDASGAVLANQAYDAYGAESSTGIPAERLGYNARWGYLYDRDTGLYYCQNRYYDPTNGRWLTRDPIGFSGGINLYGYCASGPVNRADPEGLVAPLLIYAAMILGTMLLTAGNAETPMYPCDMHDPAESGREKWAAAEPFLEFACGAIAARGAGAVGSSIANSARKRTPNPHGRRGGPAHRRAVERAEQDYKRSGYEHNSGGSLKEENVNGKYPDLGFTDPATGGREFVQVGKQTGKGLPVIREWENLGPISKRGPVTFIPYN